MPAPSHTPPGSHSKVSLLNGTIPSDYFTTSSPARRPLQDQVWRYHELAAAAVAAESDQRTRYRECNGHGDLRSTTQNGRMSNSYAWIARAAFCTMLLSMRSRRRISCGTDPPRLSWHSPRRIQRACGKRWSIVSTFCSRQTIGQIILIFADDMAAFNMVQSKLLASNGPPVRHIPVRVYLPASTSASDVSMGHLKVVQALVTPTIPNSREAQTLGMALHTLLPSLFPSRRTPIIAKPVLHGAIVPMAAVLEDLLRGCAYLDGWLHFGIEMMV